MAACEQGHLEVAQWLVRDCGCDARLERDWRVSCVPLCSCCIASGCWFSTSLFLCRDVQATTVIIVFAAWDDRSDVRMRMGSLGVGAVAGS